MSDGQTKDGHDAAASRKFHPHRFLEEQDLSIARATDILGVRPNTLSDLIYGKSSLLPQLAFKSEKAFGMSNDTLVRMGAWRDSQTTPQNGFRGVEWSTSKDPKFH